LYLKNTCIRFFNGQLIALALILVPLLSIGQNKVSTLHAFYSKVKPEDYRFFGGDTLKDFDLKGNFERAKAMNCSSNELQNYMLQAERVFLYAKYRISIRNPHHADAAITISRNGEHVEPSDDDKARGIKTVKDIWLSHTTQNNSHQPMGGGCNNLDFSDVAAPFTNWTAAYGLNDWNGGGSVFYSYSNWRLSTATLNAQYITPPPSGTPMTLGKDAGLNSCSWVTICTTGTDSCGGFPMVCPGFTQSCRLGGNFVNLDPGIGGGFAGCGARGDSAFDASTGKDTASWTETLVGGTAGTSGHKQFAAQGEMMEQSIPITAANSVLTINYAAVLNDGSHPPGQEPFVFFTVYDQSNNPIPCLQFYQEAISGAFPPGFLKGDSINWIQNTLANSGGEYRSQCYYKPWTAASFDMTRYIGQTVKFQAIACGCWQGGHFAYVYIDISCGPQQFATANTTCGSGTITAPAGDSSYHWLGPCISGSNKNQTVTVTCSGTYSCVAILAGGKHCADTIIQNVTIVSNPTPTITAVPGTSICTGGSGTTLNVTGAGAGGTYSWSTGATTSSISVNPIVTTTYSVTATTATLGCSGSKTVVVTVNNTPTISVSATPTTTICSGTTVTLNTSGGTGGTTYSWSTGQTTSSINVTPGSTTTYTVTATNGACQGPPQTIVISVNPTPTLTASANPSTTICAGSSVKLTANPSGLASYSWTPTGTLTTTTYDTTTATPTVTTTYTVTGTTAAGCTNTTPATVVVKVNVSPTVSISALPSLSICSGNSTILTASGAATYLWSTSATTSAIIVGPTTTTTYTVTGKSAAGCANSNSTQTVVVTVTTTPTVTVNPASPGVCPGDTAVLTANGATTYLWSSGQTTDTIVSHPASNTTYTVTGKNGTCSGSQTVTVTVGAINVTATASSLGICFGQPDTIKASGAATYTWSTGSTNSSFIYTATKDTSFSVVGKSGAGCKDSAKVSITISTPATITASSTSPTKTVCPGDTTQAYVTITGAGTPPYTYNWNTIPVQTNDTAWGLGAGTYTVTISDANHCVSDTATVIITTQNIVVAASASPSGNICSGGSTLMTATGATNYIWRNSTGLTDTIYDTATAYPTITTTYTVFGTTTGTCKDSATVLITVNSTPTVIANASGTAICAGQSTILTANGASSYTWTPSTGLKVTTGSPITANPGTSTTYIVTGTSAAGCPDTASVSVTVNPTPTISLKVSGNDTICKGKSVTITASGGTTYAWSPGGGTGSSINVSPATSPTTYTVVAYSANGACTDTNKQAIYLFPPLTVNMKALDSVCSGKPVTIDAQVAGGDPLPGYTYSWTPSLGTGAGPYIVNPTTSTTYSCTATDGCGNSTSSETVVGIDPTPKAIFTATPNPVYAGEYVAFVDNSTLADSWYWTFGTNGATSTASFPYYQYDVAGNYIVTLWVTSKDGCRDSTSDTVHVLEIIYVPNVFTPNGDGQNDVFHVTATSIKTYSIEIFNRWGQKVFSADSPNVDWDGKSMAGVEESDGIYFYLIKATDYVNKDYNLKGYVQLIR
jgi:gliding motility-associated-like protein